MSKISTYLGIRKDATTAENPNEQSYGTALAASGFLAVLILISALANHPVQGIPSHLYGYLPGVNGGGNWITAEGLGPCPLPSPGPPTITGTHCFWRLLWGLR